MAENFHKSRHTGTYIDDQIEQVGKNTSSIAGLTDQLNKVAINKAEKSQIPTSISDLVHDAALVYVGDKAPEDDKYDVWIYNGDSVENKVFVKTSDGLWVSAVAKEVATMAFYSSSPVDTMKYHSIREITTNFFRGYIYMCVDLDNDGRVFYIQNVRQAKEITFASAITSDGKIHRLKGEVNESGEDVWTMEVIDVVTESSESGVSPDELHSLAYYGDINIKPSDSSLFEFTTDDTTMTASIKAKSTDISGDIVIPYEYIVEGKIYKVTTIEKSGFSRTALTSIIIPTSVSIIDEAAFLDCSGLSHVNIPNSVKEIRDFAFTWNSFQNVVIPDSVETIGGYAFHESTVKTLDLGESIAILKEGSFSNCEQLVSAVIPASLHSIEKNVFQLCESLADVYFKGTKEQWDGIIVESNNEPLINATVHYDWSEGNNSSGEQEIVYANVSTTDGVLTSDKTFDEMYEAVQSGKTVVAIHGSERLTLTIIEPAILWFSTNYHPGGNYGTMRMLICTKYDGVNYTWSHTEIYLASKEYVDTSVSEATPVRGVDYWTEEDKAEIKNYIDETKEVLIVHGNIGADGTVILDKTFAEVKAAIDSGKHVELRGTMESKPGWEYTAYLLAETEDLFVFRINGNEWYEIFLRNDDEINTNGGSYVYKPELDSLEGFVFSVSSRVGELETTVGDIETALDSIIAIQNELMGVSE